MPRRKLKGEAEDGDISIGVDIGIFELRVTSAYGGALKVEFAGQSIIWGREGGELHYKVGIFEVKVEAIDCVVTEEKIIAGQVVMTRSYPDPGCGKDKPQPAEEDNELPKIPDGITPVPTPKGMDEGIGYVLCAKLEKFSYSLFASNLQTFEPGAPTSGIIQSTQSKGFADINIVGKIPDIVSPASGTWWPPFATQSTSELTSSNIVNYKNYGGVTVAFGDWISGPTAASLTYRATKKPYSWDYAAYSYGSFFPFPNRGRILTCVYNADTAIPSQQSSSGGGEWPPGSRSRVTWTASGVPTYAVIYYGELLLIRDWIELHNKQEIKNTPTGYTYKQLIVRKVIKIGIQVKPQLPPTGNKPPMNQNCCDEINDKLDDLLEIFDVQHFQKSKFPIPAYLVAPGVDTSKELEIKNYYQLFQELFRGIAHTAIVSPKTALSKDGEVSMQNVNATSWAEALSKLLVEILVEVKQGAVFDTRTAITTTQNLITSAAIYQQTEAMLDCIGVPIKKSRAEIETAYNLVIEQKKKGFEKEAEQTIATVEGLTEEELMSILLKDRNNVFVHDDMRPTAKSLRQLIEEILSK